MPTQIEQMMLDLLSASEREKIEAHTAQQDYLAALTRTLDRKGDFIDQEMEKWDPEVVDWFNEACRAVNSKNDIPDFPDAEEEEETSDVGSDADPAEDGTDEAEGPPEKEPEAATGIVNPEGDKGTEEKEQGGDEGEAPPPQATVVTKKPSKPKPGRAKRTVRKKDPNGPKIVNFDLERDKWGCVRGTKTSQAVAMYERGCRPTDVTAALQGRFYNILKKLNKAGHRIEKFPDHTVKLTHKDDIK